MKYLIAHDIGTSANKATLFTIEGNLVKSAVHSYKVHWFNDVWAEQDANDWYLAVCKTTKSISENLNTEDVLGISFSGQMMGCLCVDKAGKPLHPSIIWADMRAKEEEIFIRSKIDEKIFYQITGHRPSASYSLAKLLWMKNNQKEIYKRTYKMLNAKDFVLQKLTGNFVTDYSDASGTNLFDLNSLTWSNKIAQATKINLELLPQLKQSTEIIGKITSKAANETGLNEGTSVICGGGDGAMAAVGARCIQPNSAFSTIGTSSWNAKTSLTPVFDPTMRIFNWAHIIPGYYIPCGTMQTAGAAINWLKDNLALWEIYKADKEDVNVYDLLNQIIEKVSIGSNGLLFLPYLMGERSPRWNPDARGCFIGVKMESSRDDFFRAVFEGVALNLGIILECINEKKSINELVITGGGAKSKVWSQIFADIYNLRIKVPKYIEEATAIGAAVTAGVGLGIFKDFSIIKKFNPIVDSIFPIPKNIEKYNQLKPIFEKSYNSLVQVFKDIAIFCHNNKKMEKEK